MWMISQALVAAAVVLIVAVVCLRVFAEIGYNGLSRITLTLCVAGLSALGIVYGLPPTYSGEAMRFLLIPYAALGLSLLLLQVLVWLGRVRRLWLRGERNRFGSFERLRDRHGRHPGPRGLPEAKGGKFLNRKK